MTARSADRKVAFEIHTPDRVRRRIVGEALAIRRAAPTAAALTHEPMFAENVTEGACHRPGAPGMLAFEHHEQLSRSPARMSTPRGENELNDLRGHRVRMGLRCA